MGTQINPLYTRGSYSLWLLPSVVSKSSQLNSAFPTPATKKFRSTAVFNGLTELAQTHILYETLMSNGNVRYRGARHIINWLAVFLAVITSLLDVTDLRAKCL